MACLTSLFGHCFSEPKSKRHPSPTAHSSPLTKPNATSPTPPVRNRPTSATVTLATVPSGTDSSEDSSARSSPPTEPHSTPAPLPSRTHPTSATLTPRMLAPLPRGIDFSSGGDARPTLHTFHPEWADNQDHLELGGEVEHAYVYEGKGKLTWPLRKMRVAGMPVESETEGDEDINEEDEDEDPEIEEEEKQSLDSKAEAQILEDLHLRERADSHRASPTPQPVVPANENGASAAKKMRVRVRRTEDADGTERLKVRVRTEGERGNESMRRLPRKKRAALDVQAVEE